MRFAVLNGSPKGDLSITLRYVRYMELKHPEHAFEVMNVAGEINRIAKDENYFRSVLERIDGADAVLWAFPLYFMLVPAQYKRFIELLFERGGGNALEGKYAASVSTSVHFMDHIAHNYIHAISEDLGMKFHDLYSAHMNDLLDEKERGRLELFISRFLDAVEKKPEIQPVYMKTADVPAAYEPAKTVNPIDTGGLGVHILTDGKNHGSNISKMVERLSAVFGGRVTITHIDEIGMKGGCLGCCRCAFENECVYNDGFRDWYVNGPLASDIIVYAGEIRDRFLSSEFKQVFDRSFFMGHTPAMKGRTIGYMVSGDLGHNEILHEFFRAFTDCGNLGYGRAISDEGTDSAGLDRRIDDFAQALVEDAKSGYIRPPTFYAVGGGKIFRDMIWGSLRPIFRADHRYYKKHKLYDFPQYDYRGRIGRAMLGLLLSLPRVRKATLPKMKEHMVRPLDKLLDDAGK